MHTECHVLEKIAALIVLLALTQPALIGAETTHHSASPNANEKSQTQPLKPVPTPDMAHEMDHSGVHAPAIILAPIPVTIEAGQRLFEGNCAACHGSTGHGDGMAHIALHIRPRNFKVDAFRYVSTENAIPSADDLTRTIRFGRRNGEMPAFPYLMDEQIQSLQLYLRSINRSGVIDKLTLKMANNPKITPEKIASIATKQTTPSDEVPVSEPSAEFRPDTAKGRVLFSTNCVACHGPEGRGDGLHEHVSPDPTKKPIKPRDLTREALRGGSNPLEVFYRIRCGIPGTEMPAHKTLADDEIWQLVVYVRHLSASRQ